MTQTWDKDGYRHPVTIVKTLPLIITQVKSNKTKDGYEAVQVGFGHKKNLNKPMRNHLKSNPEVAVLKEIKTENSDTVTVGGTVSLEEILKIGDIVTVRGISKGKGFAGVMKRWGFRGGPKTHGQSDRGRAPGSIGQGTDPGRVHRGKRMAGRMGNAQVAVQNLTILAINSAQNELWLSGPVPGSRGSILKITKKSEGKFKGLHASNLTENNDLNDKSSSANPQLEEKTE